MDFGEDYEDFEERIRKRFYYGKLPGTDRPSLPLTGLLVDYYNGAVPRKLGKLECCYAASSSRSACMTPSSVTTGMVYVKRLQKRRSEYLSEVNASELFLISMMIASKFLYDEGIDEEVFNDEWANSGDIETDEINQLELDFLSALDWELFVKPEEYKDMLNEMERRIALEQGVNRGWFSYTDLMVLSQDIKFIDCSNLVATLSKIFSATSIAYLAGILTMVGSTMLGSSTAVTMVTAGSRVLPLCIQALPSLDPLLSARLLGGLSIEPVNEQAEASNADGLVSDLMSELNEQNQSYSTQTGTDIHSPKPDVSSEPSYSPEADRKSQTRQTNNVNGFLSPFLALITLKDTLFNFAYGASFTTDSNGTIDNDAGLTDFEPTDDETADICSLGPCLPDSMPNCWNVTMETDSILYNTWTDNCLSDDIQCSHCTWERNNDNLGLNIDIMSFMDQIHCCCRSADAGHSLLKSTLHSRLMDINLRFATRSFYPIFQTT